MDKHSVFFIFFGIFWSNVLGSVSRFRPFDTAAMFSFYGQYSKLAWKRFFYAVFLLILVPLALLALFEWKLPPEEGIISTLVGAICAYSLFGVNRIFHAFVASDFHWEKFYSFRQWKRIILKWLDCDSTAKKDEEERGSYVKYDGQGYPEFVKNEPPHSINCFSQHFFPGILYFFVCPFLAWCLFLLGGKF